MTKRKRGHQQNLQSSHNCSTKTGRGIVFPGHYPQVKVEQLENVWKRYTAKHNDGAGKEGEEGPLNSTKAVFGPARLCHGSSWGLLDDGVQWNSGGRVKETK